MPETIAAAHRQSQKTAAPAAVSPAAMTIYATHLLDSQKTWPEAARILRQAMEAGHLPAQSYYAICLLWGRGVEMDKAEALRLLREAAAAGDFLARKELFWCVKAGHGTKADPATAFEMIEHWAETDLAVRRFLGAYYFHRSEWGKAGEKLAGL